jgi:hypothetical protein
MLFICNQGAGSFDKLVLEWSRHRKLPLAPVAGLLRPGARVSALLGPHQHCRLTLRRALAGGLGALQIVCYLRPDLRQPLELYGKRLRCGHGHSTAVHRVVSTLGGR